MHFILFLDLSQNFITGLKMSSFCNKAFNEFGYLRET